MGVDYDVRMVYGWLIDAAKTVAWIEENGDDCERCETWPASVDLVQASPYFDAKLVEYSFGVNVLKDKHNLYMARKTSLAELQEVSSELVEAGRRAVLMIDPDHEARDGRPPELWALPHIW